MFLVSFAVLKSKFCFSFPEIVFLSYLLFLLRETKSSVFCFCFAQIACIFLFFSWAFKKPHKKSVDRLTKSYRAHKCFWTDFIPFYQICDNFLCVSCVDKSFISFSILIFVFLLVSFWVSCMGVVFFYLLPDLLWQIFVCYAICSFVFHKTSTLFPIWNSNSKWTTIVCNRIMLMNVNAIFFIYQRGANSRFVRILRVYFVNSCDFLPICFVSNRSRAVCFWILRGSVFFFEGRGCLKRDFS